MTRRILLRREAQREFEEAAIWYDQLRKGLALTFQESVNFAVSLAAGHPDRYPHAHNEIRCIHVQKFPYRIFFTSHTDHIVVLAVFHVRRDPTIWRSRV